MENQNTDFLEIDMRFLCTVRENFETESTEF